MAKGTSANPKKEEGPDVRDPSECNSRPAVTLGTQVRDLGFGARDSSGAMQDASRIEALDSNLERVDRKVSRLGNQMQILMAHLGVGGDG